MADEIDLVNRDPSGINSHLGLSYIVNYNQVKKYIYDIGFTFFKGKKGKSNSQEFIRNQLHIHCTVT